MLITRAPWKVLLVDDDSAILRLGRVVLGSVSLDRTPVEILTAPSASTARSVIEQNPDLAVAVIDVVMETPTAGLELANWIAAQDACRALRVAIHSGQPAELRQESVERNYEIHDYWHKSATSAVQMRTRLLFLLRNHRDLLRACPPPTPVAPTGDDTHWCLVYTSIWNGAEAPTVLLNLAADFRSRNQTMGITGLLLLERKRILQVLEGPRGHVEALYSRIKLDPRHREVTLQHTEQATSRAFPHWSMQFIDGANLGGSMPVTLFESVRAYAAGHRPTPGGFAQMLVSLLPRPHEP